MDYIKARQLEAELSNKSLSGYQVIEYINCGKSAAVFKAKKNGENYALKIFDNELVERFGHEIQLKRINQEIGLKGHTIDNLVKIFDGGKDEILGSEYYYLVMELIKGKNLKEFIDSEDYSESFIVSVFEKLYNVTNELLTQNNPIVHRDIKPENIMITNDRDVILMDLGVLKFVGVKSMSDVDEKQFLGTLRYAPPEFLTRKEKDSIEGWNSVNLYQIGGVIHDLIQKKELFSDKTPYTNLVLAIKEDPPRIIKNGYSFSLIQMVRNLLTKDWELRNQLCSKEKIDEFRANVSKKKSSIEKKIDEIQSMSFDFESAINEIEKIQRSNQEKLAIRREISKKLIHFARSPFKFIVENRLALSYSESKAFKLLADRKNREKEINNYLVKLKGDVKLGYSSELLFWVRIVNDEKYFVEISTICFILSPFLRNQNLSPDKLLESIFNETNRLRQFKTEVKLIEVFSGVIDLECLSDVDELIIEKKLNLLKKAKEMMKPNVEGMINQRRSFAENGIGNNNTIVTSTRIIDKI